jgi:photosystem II stability/assembly factor-like uncharacterized protein
VFGLYKSADRGLTWNQVHPFGSYGVVVSQQNANVVYSVSSGGPIRSSDGGVTFGSPGNGSPPLSLIYLALDPQNDNVVYASSYGTGVFKSVDGATNWTSVSNGLTDNQIRYLLIDPANASTLYTIGGLSLFKTVDAAATWTAVPVANTSFYSIGIGTATSPSTLLGATTNGVMKSADGGTTWSHGVFANVQGAGNTLAAMDPFNANIVFGGSSGGLYRSTNGGTSFTASSKGLTAYYTQAITVDSHQPSVVYAAGYDVSYKSSDRGQTWTKAGPFASQLAVDAFNSSTLYAISSGAVIRTIDAGSTWQSFGTGLQGSVYLLAVDPLNANTIFAGQSGTVYRRSGTDAWTKLSSTGLPDAFLNFLVIDPRSSSTLYTGTSSAVFKTTDGGANWTAANTGLEATAINGLAIDPFDSNHLLAWNTASAAYLSSDAGAHWTAVGFPAGTIQFDPATRGLVYGLNSTALNWSPDGGAHWSGVPIPDSSFSSILAISPDGKTIYRGGTSAGVWSYTYGSRRRIAHH